MGRLGAPMCAFVRVLVHVCVCTGVCAVASVYRCPRKDDSFQ